MKFFTIIFLMAVSATSFSQGQKPRARDIGIPFDGTPGKYNAITDGVFSRISYALVEAAANGSGSIMVLSSSCFTSGASEATVTPFNDEVADSRVKENKC